MSDVYRTPGATAPYVAAMTCPCCGGSFANDAPACPHCDVQFASIRCPRCLALHCPGVPACRSCGEELRQEPLLDATDAPCPRCKTPLRVAQGGVHLADEVAGAAVLHECPSCRGAFLDNSSLQAVLSRRGALGPGDAAAPAHHMEEVHYLPCPLCNELMNRVNFGRRSGVIVDVCASHGTWFDAGELARAVAFAAKGGLLESRRIDEKEKRELAQRAARLQAELVCDERAGPTLGGTLGGWAGRLAVTWGEHRGTLLDILARLFQ